MRSRIIARAYIKGRPHLALPTTPGRMLYFRGGCAEVTDERDMPHVLRREDVHVDLEPEWLDFLPRWAAKCGFGAMAPKATVRCVGREVGPPPTYDCGGAPAPAAEPQPEVEKPRPSAEASADGWGRGAARAAARGRM